MKQEPQVQNRSVFSNISVNSDILRANWLIIPLLLLALIIRLPYLPIIGSIYDSGVYASWSNIVYHEGPFNIYRTAGPDYPPIYLLLLGVVAHFQALSNPVLELAKNPAYVVWLKAFPVCADLILVAVAFFWLTNRRVLRLIIPLWLAISPAILADSAWWGQTDTMMTLMLVLTLIALNKDRPRLAWALYVLGILLKFQCIALAPLVGTLSLRRYGISKTGQGVAVAAVIALGILSPFLVTSGIRPTLAPYLGVVDGSQFISVNAYNLWYAATPYRDRIAPFPTDPILSDQQRAFGLITFKQAGFLMLGLYTAVICLSMWRHANDRREFVWATALYFGFFMLPTQMHERYILPVAILSVFAIAQDPRMLIIALGSTYTVAHNILIEGTFTWLGISRPIIWPKDTSLYTALFNIALIVETTQIMLTSYIPTQKRRWWQHVTIGRVGMVGLCAALFVTLFIRYMNYVTASWAVANIADSEHLAFEWAADDTQRYTGSWPVGTTWRWSVANKIEDKPVDMWFEEGAHYLLIDERTTGSQNFDERIAQLVAQDATVIYESNRLLTFGTRQAILWTFRPQHPLDLTFDNTIKLIGYNLVVDKPALEFQWLVQKETPVDYHIFIHCTDPSNGEIIDQADTMLGGFIHPTSKWRSNEFVFETIGLPADKRCDNPHELRIGIYDFQSGQRAVISDKNGTTVGDYFIAALQ